MGGLVPGTSAGTGMPGMTGGHPGVQPNVRYGMASPQQGAFWGPGPHGGVDRLGRPDALGMVAYVHAAQLFFGSVNSGWPGHTSSGADDW